MQIMTDNQFRLSPQQRRICALQGSSRTYNTQAACLIEGELDLEALWLAVRSVVERHEAFRTRLRYLPGLKYPVQEITDETKWQSFDHSHWDASTCGQDFSSLLEQERARHDLLGDDSPLSITLVPLDRARHVLVVSSPAVCADSWTLRNFFAELAVALDPRESASTRSDAPVQYADYAIWRNELWEQDNELTEEGRAYWNKNFNLKALDCRLPGQAAARPASQFIPRFAPLRIDERVSAKLASMAEEKGESIESLLLACWGSLLFRFTQMTEIPVGVTLEGRPHEELLGSMGLFTQTVPVSMRFPPDLSFAGLIRDTGDEIRRAILWQDYFQWPETGDAVQRFCPFGFSWKPQPQTHRAGELRFTVCAESSTVDRFELQLACSGDGESIKGMLVYDPACFDSSQVEQLARRFERLSAALGQAGGEQVRGLPVLTSEDTRQLLVEWNRTRDDSFRAACVHHRFEEQVEQTPDSIAVVCGDQKLSYRELNRRANQLAHRLRSSGVGLETPVCLFVGRSVEMLVGMFGILKAGAVYVPLDTAYPVKERIAHIIQDTGSPVIVTHERLRRHVPEELCEVISLDDDELISKCDTNNLAVKCGPENLAYIIYTSGSTGKPKGVMVQHGSVVNLWGALGKAIYNHAPGEGHRATLNAPISFDASIKQILLLLGGHTLHVLTEEVRGNPDSFVNYVRENRISILDCTPSHLRLLLDAGLLDRKDEAPALALVGGESVDLPLWNKLAGNGATQFYNVYGPTECTGDATSCGISSEIKTPSIGHPLANVQAYVLDQSLNLQPIGVPGELYIAGEGLARGYWNRPDLTAERFVAHPFASYPGERIYKTGDVARHLPDGSIECLGRVDHQVKVRGFRVELGEISAALVQHSKVREAVVTTHADASGGNRLVAYVVPSTSSTPAPAELRQHLESRLPEYMIPAVYMTLDALPLSSNNKVDRSALPIPDQLRPELSTDFQPPTSPVEIALAAIWESVLGVKEAGVRDNFFELGGHSLLAMQVISRVRKEFAVDVVVPRLFQRPTIEGLAAAIEEALGRKAHASASIPALPRGTKGIDQFKDRLNELVAGGQEVTA